MLSPVSHNFSSVHIPNNGRSMPFNSYLPMPLPGAHFPSVPVPSRLHPTSLRRFPSRAGHTHLPRRPPPEKTRSPSGYTSFTSVLDPLGILSSSTGFAKKSQRIKEEPKDTMPTTTQVPSLVYIPDGGKGECGDYQDSGFNAYSFIGFLLGVVNIVTQVANNVNNNLNSNNNNNNNNNNNLGNINAANSNSNQNNDNSINIPAAMGGRRRRYSEDKVAEEGNGATPMGKEGNMAADVAIPFMRAYYMINLGENQCILRIVCETNFENVWSRDTELDQGLAKVFTEIYTLGLAEWTVVDTPAGGILEAGSYGRDGANCSDVFPQCSEEQWRQLTSEARNQLTFHLEPDLRSNKKIVKDLAFMNSIAAHRLYFSNFRALPKITNILDMFIQ